MHFQPIECTFAAPAEFCQSFHCLVAVGILEETDRNVSGINMLNRMRIVSVDFHEQSEDNSGQKTEAIHVDDQSFVGTIRFDDFIGCPLGCDVVLLLKQGGSYNIFERQD